MGMADFSSYVKLPRGAYIPKKGRDLNNITHEILASEGKPLDDAIAQFKEWIASIQFRARVALAASELPLVSLVAHNGFNFDFRVLLLADDSLFSPKSGVGHLLDTLVASKTQRPWLFCHKLPMLYTDTFNETLENAHDALADAQGLARLFTVPPLSRACDWKPLGSHRTADVWSNESKSQSRPARVSARLTARAPAAAHVLKERRQCGVCLREHI